MESCKHTMYLFIQKSLSSVAGLESTETNSNNLVVKSICQHLDNLVKRYFFNIWIKNLQMVVQSCWIATRSKTSFKPQKCLTLGLNYNRDYIDGSSRYACTFKKSKETNTGYKQEEMEAKGWGEMRVQSRCGQRKGFWAFSGTRRPGRISDRHAWRKTSLCTSLRNNPRASSDLGQQLLTLTFNFKGERNLIIRWVSRQNKEVVSCLRQKSEKKKKRNLIIRCLETKQRSCVLPQVLSFIVQSTQVASSVDTECILRRIPSIGIHFCPKKVIFESAPKVVAIDKIW